MRTKCKICEEDNGTYSRGLCRKCYIKATRDGTLNKYRIYKPRKKKCTRCGNKRKIFARGMCQPCYRAETTITKQINGKELTFSSAAGREKVQEFVDKKEKEVMEDIINNPRKWLDKVNINRKI